jgi:hypothetical protein
MAQSLGLIAPFPPPAVHLLQRHQNLEMHKSAAGEAFFEGNSSCRTMRFKPNGVLSSAAIRGVKSCGSNRADYVQKTVRRLA